VAQTMQFFLFVSLVALLFLRPQEILPGLGGASLYELVILAAMAASALSLLGQLSPQSLTARPTTVCVLGLLVAVVLSHLSNFLVEEAATWGFRFFKVVVLYLLLLASVHTVGQLRRLLLCLAALILALGVLAVLQYHEVINVPDMEAYQQRLIDPATGEPTVLPRLCGPGIFHDPNDLSVILALGVLLGLYWLGERRQGGLRWAWLLPVGMFGYAIVLTHSRGGLLALLAGLVTLLYSRFSGWKSTALTLLIVPALLVAMAGRATQFDLGDKNNTAQSRIHHWSDGLVLFKESPVFGIGAGQFGPQVGVVAHNSFVEAFTELGLLGGTFFFGMFAYCLWSLRRVGRRKARGLDPALQRLRPFVTAMVVAFAVGLLSLSRNFNPPTYLLLGLVAVYLRLVEGQCPGTVPRLSASLASRGVLLGLVFLGGIHTFVVVMIQRG
jgi:putative inorganic carbon (HCO3(-)) transporter